MRKTLHVPRATVPFVNDNLLLIPTATTPGVPLRLICSPSCFVRRSERQVNRFAALPALFGDGGNFRPAEWTLLGCLDRSRGTCWDGSRLPLSTGCALTQS